MHSTSACRGNIAAVESVSDCLLMQFASGGCEAKPQSWPESRWLDHRYGQARRKGRMLVAKLDYLQLIVIKGSLASVGKKAQQLWHGITARVNPPIDMASSENSSSE